MSESMADLALELALAEERQRRIQGDASSGPPVAAPERDRRWRRYLAAGFLMLARWMEPVAYADRMTPAEHAVVATARCC